MTENTEKKPRRSKVGRPRFRPTQEQRKTVRAMSAYGIPQPDIAAVIGIAERTLREHFRQELDTAGAEATAKVAQMLYRQATKEDGGSPSVTAAIFWLKTRGGWRETSVHEVTGKDGGPVEHITRTIVDPKDGQAD